ncbi:unnamed protein product [Fusarium graminearum]|nr:unnamed protein product [Fusarium graminearum]
MTRRRKARGKGNRGDQFCIYRTSDDQNVPVVAIEYKAPHKLRRGEIVTGLVSEIQPDRDVKASSLGISIPETYVFLQIPDDPSCVYYSVCVPSLDVQDDDETRLHRTAVAQAFAFVLQAIRSPPPCQAWHDAAEHLDTWAVDEDDDDGESPSPTPNPTVGRSGLTTSTDVGSSEMQEHDGSAASQEGTIDLQGMFVPVCLGTVHLTKPYYYDSGVYKDFMFLSYGGRPFLKHSGEVSPGIANEILAALGRLHQHGVLHHDAEPRNVLYDKRAEGYMIVDLMMAEFHNRQPLGPINVNGRNQKRK